MAIGWQFWALLSAVFAALTAILAKVGVEEVNPDVATFIRTLVVVSLLGGLLLVTGQRMRRSPQGALCSSSYRGSQPGHRGYATFERSN